MDNLKNDDTTKPDNGSKIETDKKNWGERINWIGLDRLWNYLNSFATVGVFLFVIVQNHLVTESTEASKQSAKAAIDAVKISERQFEIENTPYLTVAEIKVIEFVVDKPIKINYTYLNVGNQIVKLKSSKVGFSIESESFGKDTLAQISYINKLLPGESAIAYVSNQVPYYANFTSSNSIQKDSFNSLKARATSFYMLGEVLYENLINHKPRKLRFVFKLVTQELTPEVYTIRLENSDLTLK